MFLVLVPAGWESSNKWMDFRLIQDQLILESSELGHHPEMESYYEPPTSDGDN